MKHEVPLWEKINLTVSEAAELFNLGTDKIKELVDNDDGLYSLKNGSKRLVKRKQFEIFLAEIDSV